ncbi:hypothetical protein SZ54_4830 [Rhizobium sp. UR51a]|nr:hypothetical protein SZ54_4830 [Rhizobium sp. UR51a]
MTGISFMALATASASSVPAFDRLQIMQDSGIGAGVNHVRHGPGAFLEALAKLARFIVACRFK